MAGIDSTLSVDLNGLRLPSPVVAASGCFGARREMAGLVDPRKLGAVVTRSVTPGPLKGAATPRAAETASGMVSAVGLQNPGIDAFLADELPRLARIGIPLIASVAGATMADFVRVASMLQGAPGVVALEIYLSGSDEEHAGEPFVSTPDHAATVVGAVARLSRLPVFAKLPYLHPDLVDTAVACVRAGAHGLTLIDAVPAMGIDVGRLRPKLAAGLGGLTGPAIHPIAVACVYRVAQAVPGVPIFGVGGVASAEDALELLFAGAWAIQIGTAMFVDPSAPAQVAQGIDSYLRARGLASPADLRGAMRVPAPIPEPGGRRA